MNKTYHSKNRVVLKYLKKTVYITYFLCYNNYRTAKDITLIKIFITGGNANVTKRKKQF